MAEFKITTPVISVEGKDETASLDDVRAFVALEFAAAVCLLSEAPRPAGMGFTSQIRPTPEHRRMGPVQWRGPARPFVEQPVKLEGGEDGGGSEGDPCGIPGMEQQAVQGDRASSGPGEV